MFETLSGMRIRPAAARPVRHRPAGRQRPAGSHVDRRRANLHPTAQIAERHRARRADRRRADGVDMVEAIKRLPTELARLTDDPSKRTDFQSPSAQFNFSNGVARNHDLRLNSSLFSLQGHGKVDLVGNIIDYAMRVQPNILVFTNTKEMNVPLKITGALNAPTYALDFNALVKDKRPSWKTAGAERTAEQSVQFVQNHAVMPPAPPGLNALPGGMQSVCHRPPLLRLLTPCPFIMSLSASCCSRSKSPWPLCWPGLLLTWLGVEQPVWAVVTIAAVMTQAHRDGGLGARPGEQYADWLCGGLADRGRWGAHLGSLAAALAVSVVLARTIDHYPGSWRLTPITVAILLGSGIGLPARQR